MSEKSYVVERHLSVANGSETSCIVGAYSDIKVAEDAIAEMKVKFETAMKAQLVVMTPDGPQPLGISGGDLIRELGIHNLKHRVFTVEPVGALLAVPRPEGPRIILPNN